jgi:hypothetical protein
MNSLNGQEIAETGDKVACRNIYFCESDIDRQTQKLYCNGQ